MLRPSTPRRRFAVVLLAGCALVTLTLVPAAATTAAGGDGPASLSPPPTSTTATQSVECDPDEERVDLYDRADEFEYADGLLPASRDEWTGGEIVPFGAKGDCSLSVTNGSASLTATTVDGERGVFRATVDVGRGGSLSLSQVPGALNDSNATAAEPTTSGTAAEPTTNATAGNGTNATAPTLAVRNVGAENDPRIELVTRGPSGTVDSIETTAPSGRFFDVEVRFRANGTARVAVWDTDDAEPAPADWRTVRVVAENETDAGAWRVTLHARAYLDEIATGARETSDDRGGADEGDPDDGVFTMRVPNDADAGGDGDDPATGLVLGPFVVALGAGIFKFAYGLTRFNEQLDAIGSTTKSSEVEPAGWNVAITRFVGAAIAVGGLLWILSSLVTIFF